MIANNLIVYRVVFILGAKGTKLFIKTFFFGFLLFLILLLKFNNEKFIKIVDDFEEEKLCIKYNFKQQRHFYHKNPFVPIMRYLCRLKLMRKLI